MLHPCNLQHAKLRPFKQALHTAWRPLLRRDKHACNCWTWSLSGRQTSHALQKMQGHVLDTRKHTPLTRKGPVTSSRPEGSWRRNTTRRPLEAARQQDEHGAGRDAGAQPRGGAARSAA